MRSLSLRRAVGAVAVLSTAAVVALSGLAWAADEKPEKPADKPAAKKERADPRGFLPLFYSKVVDPIQREKIYAIQDKYEAQLEALERQMADLRAKRDAEIRALLRPEQLQRLEELIDAARKEKEAEGDKGEKPAAEAGAEK